MKAEVPVHCLINTFSFFFKELIVCAIPVRDISRRGMGELAALTLYRGWLSEGQNPMYF